MKRRSKKARPTTVGGVRYRSRFEAGLASRMDGCSYEGWVLPYYIEREYTPDWVNKDETVWFEAKAYFRTYEDARRYKFIADQVPDGVTFVFIFKDPNKPMPGARRRKKCGTKQSVSEWADKQGIAWCTPDTVDEWL